MLSTQKITLITFGSVVNNFLISYWILYQNKILAIIILAQTKQGTIHKQKVLTFGNFAFHYFKKFKFMYEYIISI